LFNGLGAGAIDSALFYAVQVPLSILLLYGVRPADQEAQALRLLNVVCALYRAARTRAAPTCT
jgi:hypothetical protein